MCCTPGLHGPDDSLGEFAHRAPAARRTERETGTREHPRIGVGDRDRPAHQFEAGQVVEVVAEVGDAIQADPAFPRPVDERGALVVAALDDVDAELARRGQPTTGSVSVDRISTGTPASRSIRTPSPSARLTRTNSSPALPTSAVLSVWTPSKSVTTASTSIAPGRSTRGASAEAIVNCSSVSSSIAVVSATTAMPTVPKKRCRAAVNPSAFMT